MSTVFCHKRQQAGTKMTYAPIPGSLGQRIVNEISQEAWSQWLDHQTILINEYRLNLLDAEARKFLLTEMENFLFGKGSDKPEAYSNPEA
ncbi:MAG: oxidative damage protection protein [Francisellaceae bacterium]